MTFSGPRSWSSRERHTTDSIRRLPPNERLGVAIDQCMLWENLDEAWTAGADIRRVSPNGATAWTGLAALLDAWTGDYHWRMPEGQYRVDFLVEQSQRLIDAGVPVDGNVQPGSVKGNDVSFLEAVARSARRLKDVLDPVMVVLLEAGADPQRANGWHTAVEWSARDKRPEHPLRRWQIELEQAELRAALAAPETPGTTPAADVPPRSRPRI